MHSHTSDLSQRARLSEPCRCHLFSLSLSSSLYLLCVPFFLSFFFFASLPFRFAFFFLLFFEKSRRSPSRRRDWSPGKMRIKKRTATVRHEEERRRNDGLAHLADHCESHGVCALESAGHGGTRRRGGRHTSAAERATCGHKALPIVKHRSIFHSLLSFFSISRAAPVSRPVFKSRRLFPPWRTSNFLPAGDRGAWTARGSFASDLYYVRIFIDRGERWSMVFADAPVMR